MADLSKLSDEGLLNLFNALNTHANTAPNETGPFQAALIGAGKTLTNLGRGAQQLYYGATGNDQAAQELKKTVDEENALYQPLADKYPNATDVGEAAPVVAGGPFTMAAMGGLEYGSPFERGVRAGAGFLGGKAGELIAKGIGRARPAIGQLFDKYGISDLPGQLSGNKPLQWATSVLANLPGGAPVRSAIEAQQTGLNRVAMGAMGAGGDSVTPEAVQLAKQGIGQTFQQVPQGVTVDIAQPTANKLLGIEQNYYKNLSPDQRTIVKSYIDDILQYANQGGMPGDVYQKARSRIAARAASTQDSELKTALSGVAKTLDEAFDASANPAASAAMKDARAQWRAAKTLEPLARESGDISAARLSNAAKGMPGTLGDLAKLGEAMRPLPQSGSAERLFYQSLLTGIPAGAAAYAADPTSMISDAGKAGVASVVAPYIASLALTNPVTRRLATRGLLNVSPATEALLQRVGASSGGLLGLSLAP